MATISNLNTLLQNNPFAPIIIPIIQYLNEPNQVQKPFSALAVANLLKVRLGNWGGGSAAIYGNGINYTTVCYDTCDPKKPYCYAGPLCPDVAGCPGEDNCDDVKTPADSAYGTLRGFAALAGAEDPYTSHVLNFAKQLDGIATNAVNAYVYMQQIVDVFYDNVSFISFFTNEWEQGIYGPFIVQSLGGDFQQGYRATGLSISTIGGSDNPATSIDYSQAVAASLPGTYFKMYNGANDGYLFYYETPANPVNPDSLGVAYTTAVAINISANGSGGCYQAAGGVSFVCLPKSRCVNGECIYDISGIQDITTAAIIGTGAFTESGVCDGSPYCSGYIATADGDWDAAVGGTANIGGTYQNTTVTAPDGTVFATGITDDNLFAEEWNNNVPAYMATLGITTHYLKPVKSFIGVSTTQGNVLLQTRYPSITEDITFNTPGVSSWSGQNDSCSTCFY